MKYLDGPFCLEDDRLWRMARMNLEGDSHTRIALDKIWTRVFELDNGQAREFEGGWLAISGAGG